jgi:hypothetical protein
VDAISSELPVVTPLLYQGSGYKDECLQAS